MSSILLSNPYVPPGTGNQHVVPLDSILPAIAPARPTESGGGAGTATDFFGGRRGTGAGARALIENLRASVSQRPATATPRSVFEARAQAELELLPFALNLPEVEMPDPIPTSPFLLALRGKD